MISHKYSSVWKLYPYVLRAVLQQCILWCILVFTRASLFPWKLLPQPGRLSRDYHIGINADKNTSAVSYMMWCDRSVCSMLNGVIFSEHTPSAPARAPRVPCAFTPQTHKPTSECEQELDLCQGRERITRRDSCRNQGGFGFGSSAGSGSGSGSERSGFCGFRARFGFRERFSHLWI